MSSKERYGDYSNQRQGNSSHYHGRQSSNYPKNQSYNTERERAQASQGNSSVSRGNNGNYERSNYSEKQSFNRVNQRNPGFSKSYSAESERNSRNYTQSSNYTKEQSYETESRREPASSQPYSSEYQGNRRNYAQSSNYPEKQSCNMEIERAPASSRSYNPGSGGNSRNYEQYNYSENLTGYNMDNKNLSASSRSYTSRSQGNGQNNQQSDYQERSYFMDSEKVSVSSRSHSSEFHGSGRNYSEQSNNPEREGLPASSRSYSKQSQNSERSANHPEKLFSDMERKKVPTSSKSYDSEPSENRKTYDSSFHYFEKQSFERERIPNPSRSYSSETQVTSQSYNRSSNHPGKPSYNVEKDSFHSSRSNVAQNRESSGQFGTSQQQNLSPSSKHLMQESSTTVGGFSQNIYKKSFNIKRERVSPFSKPIPSQNQGTSQSFVGESNHFKKESFDSRECAPHPSKANIPPKQKMNKCSVSPSNFPQKEFFDKGREMVPDSSNIYCPQVHERRKDIKCESSFPQKKSYEQPARDPKPSIPNFSALFDIPQNRCETSLKSTINSNQVISSNTESNFDRREGNVNLRHNTGQDRTPLQDDPSYQGYQRGEQKMFQNQDQKYFGDQVPKSNFPQHVEMKSQQSWHDETSDDYQNFQGGGDGGRTDEDMEYNDMEQNEELEHYGGLEHNEDIDQYEGDVVKNALLYMPPPDIIQKYMFYPPTAQEMARMFQDMVLFFFYKTAKVKEENNPFRIICESFRLSSSHQELSVEDGYSKRDKHVRYCTLRYCNMMMARGMGSFGVTKEARMKAGIKLINNLSQTCFTLRMKQSYYSNDGLKKMLSEREQHGVFKVISEEEIPDDEYQLKQLMDIFFQEDTDCELIFTNKAHKVRSVARQLKLHLRKMGPNCTGVSKSRTPQYWRDLLLSRGQMENEKFVLVPPQGFGNKLIKDEELNRLLQPYKKRMVGPAIEENEMTLYGPQGVGPDIKIENVTWRREGGRRGGGRGGRRGGGRGGGRGRGRGRDPFFSGGMSKGNRQKMNKIKTLFAEGQNVMDDRSFKMLPKRLRKRVRGTVENMMK